MTKLKYILILLILTIGFGSCDRDLESEGLTEGVIRFPSIIMNGDEVISLKVGDTYQDEGAKALLGTDDITGQLTTEGNVDTSVPGVYLLDYSVSVVNELDEQSSVSATRFVIVTAEDAINTDLSGDYKGTGFSANPKVVRVTKLLDGYYNIEDVLSSGNGISVNFAHVGGNEIIIPDQTTGFGNVNTTSPGTAATLTPEGFTWTVFISCCGNFGPVTFVKQ